ncbi:hypothetical protein SAMN02745751_02318 [Dethiosulfatibacter aminovorans DSM 17477]|uniref:Uncharacterized protein n=1 Tax=Dethiosulfatibacter aminovorans DSM 17477 TaxID=1121476 RepID=A0A1M6IGS5_9FIRM|nr:hypothetical protein [Dethiosulfatibacter aminovorans]SHJ33619.1 hypothetical protein SAMN02745751_02318 [Dethiosulfatibacter aminovorans DSM 17477]
MDEYSRILIEEYCRKNNSKKSHQLWELLELSYSMDIEPGEEDAIFLEKMIHNEKNPELKEALRDLDEFLFG